MLAGVIFVGLVDVVFGSVSTPAQDDLCHLLLASVLILDEALLPSHIMRHLLQLLEAPHVGLAGGSNGHVGRTEILFPAEDVGDAFLEGSFGQGGLDEVRNRHVGVGWDDEFEGVGGGD